MTPSSSTFFIIFLQIISHLATTSHAADPLIAFCSDDNYTSPTPFASGLRQLIANLLAITPTSRNKYYINEAGPAEAPLVFGLAQCRPDVTAARCDNCLVHAASTAFNGSQCAGRKSASIRNANCVLRYADHPFFSVLQNSHFATKFSVKRAVNAPAFSRQVGDMLAGLLPVAMGSPMRIAAGAKAIDSEPAGESNLKIYGLAWCTLDLSPGDCYQCMDHVLKNYDGCCSDKMAGGTMSESCIVTYDNYVFFNISLLQAAPSPSAEIGMERRSNSGKKITLAISINLAILSALTICCIILIIHRKRLASRRISKLDAKEEFKTIESLLLPFTTLKAATSNFCDEYKLGKGRFGPVYKGELSDGRQIVVKRLSNASGQGLVELRNEAALVAQLQHKNLVKLLGCCMENDENLLVYEYLANASLDKHLIDPAARAQLNWRRRHAIIEGIGRGLVYLHNHSRLTIIHRNLNASNILLDADMNPKISDFGLAKLVDINESLWVTKQIYGTYGYMAPEYAARGLFSTKSDVFSYGMVVLEIITGRRNVSFIEVGKAMNLQTQVWQHWNIGKAEEIIDQCLGGTHQLEEALRCINIGLLCVQADPAERPSMSWVVLMLSTNSETLPSPSLPAYFTGENPQSASSETSSSTSTGTNHDLPSIERFSGSNRCWRQRSMNKVSLDIMQAR